MSVWFDFACQQSVAHFVEKKKRWLEKEDVSIFSEFIIELYFEISKKKREFKKHFKFLI